jgi:hypothetical protein
MVHELNAGRIAGAALMVAGITLISLLTHSNEAELEFQSGRARNQVRDFNGLARKPLRYRYTIPKYV